ncbi:MAG: DUF4294 domain-containing protein [Bacteroidales bacterium]|nr:DUF4294 domain-containing protein [Bacteroidales bacterium]
MFYRFILTILIFFNLGLLHAQDTTKNVLRDTIKLKNFEVVTTTFFQGETIPHRTIEEIIVFPARKFKNRRQARKYTRLIYNVKKVYPYATLARDKMIEMNNHLLTLSTEKEQKRYIQQVENELREEFEDDLRKMTFTQGRLLIKLIDRETGNTTYVLIKELKGSFSAFFWQAIARIFKSNLKTEFDARGEDRIIDEIIYMIDAGLI